MSWPFGDKMVASTNTPSSPPLAQVQPSPSSHGVARPAAVSGLAGTDTVQLVEFAASAVVWVKLSAAPDASTAFEPAAPARPGGVTGGMPIARGVVAGGEAEAGAGAAGGGGRGAAAAARGGRSARARRRHGRSGSTGTRRGHGRGAGRSAGAGTGTRS